MKTSVEKEPAGTGGPGNAVMRVRGLIRKEFFQILRDPSSMSIAFLMPVVLLLLFGYGVSLDAKNVDIGLVVEQPSAETADFTDLFSGSEYFNPIIFFNLQPAIDALMARRIKGIVHLRTDFVEQLKGPGSAPIQVLINGVDANTARLIAGYVNGVWTKWLQRQTSTGQALTLPVEVRQRVWFNSGIRSRNFLVPGLIAVIMTLIGALLTALVMAREWERGTMEALMVTPVAIREIIIGKLLPYFILGTGGMLLSLSMAVFLFDVPLRGSLWVLFAAAGLFLLAALGMGLLISTVTKNQFVAAQMAIIITFLPAFILSGFIFDIGSMPRFIQLLTYLIAARYFVAILQTVFLAGNMWSVIVPNALALAVMAAVLLGLNRWLYRKRLE
ncbi:MAG: ABC transporter permease [Desulfobacterales bacterium]|jgi:ABC-2 type transport system permease protein